jgi:dihydrofolate synthase/folylpolyglutamate synthase
MTYQQTIDWLYSLQTLGIKLGLDNMRALVTALDLERPKATVFHIAGTNGKGSTCAMLDSICRAAGLKTGLFTSPHLINYRERARVEGKMISEEDVIRYAAQIRNLAKDWEAHPTFFEVTLGISLLFFRDQKVNVIVLETGLGGRLDATSAVMSDVSIVTPIGLDHQQLLGETLAEIASEKAGIFKPDVPIISSPQESETAAVLRAKATSPITFIKEPWSESPIGLIGLHQKWNAAAAVAAVRVSPLGVSEAAIKEGLAKAQWAGRFQKIAFSPTTGLILDGAHNEAGIKVLMESWQQEFGSEPVPVVVGIAQSKNTAAMLTMLAPMASEIILTGFESPRASDPNSLREQTNHPNVRVSASVPEALEILRNMAPPRALIVGSLFLIGEILAQLTNGDFEVSDQ